MKKTFGMNSHQRKAHKAGEHRVGRGEIPQLIELSKSGDPDDRLFAAGNLCPCHVRKRIPEAWEALFRMMEDPDTRVRRAAWHTLEDGGQPNDPALDPILDRIFKTETDPTVRNFAKLVAGKRQQSVTATPVRWKAVRRAQCDFCGKGTVPVDYDLQTTIPSTTSTSGSRPALICQACAGVS